MTGKAIIPSGYSDEYGQPKELDAPLVFNAAVAVSYDEDDEEFDPTVPLPPEVASQAFALATDKFNSLDVKTRDKTSVGALAIQFARALRLREQPRTKKPPAVRVTQDDLPATTNSRKKAVKTATVSEISPATPKKTKTVKRVIRVKRHVDQRVDDSGPSLISVRRPVVTKRTPVIVAPADASLASLKIPRLSGVPSSPGIAIQLRYTEQSQLVSQRFRVHWLLTYLDDEDQVTQVAMTFDRRYGESPFDELEIDFSPYESMQLVISGTQSMTLEVLRGKMVVDLGVFNTAIFNVVRP